MNTPVHLSSVLRAAEREGRLNLRIADLAAALPGVSPQALRQALYRQQLRGAIVRVSRGAGHWLIVPHLHAASGAPPLEAWLDFYLAKTLRLPYYVGLLSAAEIYGASPYAVTVTQVVVPAPRRRVTVGRHVLVFHARHDVARMPTRWHETADGRFKVSTPELTALELVQREAQVGGAARVQEVLRRLCQSCSMSGVLQALDATQEVPSAQRLGALLSAAGITELALCISHWLKVRKVRAVPLESGQSANSDGVLDPDFKVWLPSDLERANA